MAEGSIMSSGHHSTVLVVHNVREVVGAVLKQFYHLGWTEVTQRLLPIKVMDQQTSTFVDKVFAASEPHLPQILKTLKYFKSISGPALCLLVVQLEDESPPRETIYNRLFKLVQEEDHKRDEMSWIRAHIRPVGVSTVSIACQTDPENTSQREESEKQIVVKVTTLLKTPHTLGVFANELQTANIPEGSTLQQLVTNAIGPPAAGATAGREPLADSDGSSQSFDDLHDSDSESESDSSDESDGVDDTKDDRDGAERDRRTQAVQEETRRNEQRMQADAQPAQRDNIQRDALSGHGGNSSKCKNCRTREAALVLLPCGHFCVCYRCISAISRCPVCAGEIQTTVRAYRR